jgi:hypothetical protein
MPRPGRFTPDKDSVPILRGGGCAPGPVWTDAENLAFTGIQSPDHPAGNESLNRLSIFGPHIDISNSHIIYVYIIIHKTPLYVYSLYVFIL